MNRLIAFTGLAGSGKSTAAGEVQTVHGHKRLSFAHPIRLMLTGCGLTFEDMAIRKHMPIAHLGGKTPRQLMQSLGTEWGRTHVHPDIWVTLMRRILESEFAAGGSVVIDDCRFDNEAAMVHELGGLIVGIMRPGVSEKMNHASEAGLSPQNVDAWFTNFGLSRSDFCRAVVAKLEQLHDSGKHA